MQYIVYILLFAFIFPRNFYKEIRIDNIPFSTIPYLSSLGIDLDHIYKEEGFIQFAISDYDLDKLNFHNVNYQIIHDNLEEFYAQRLTNDFESRDFELGSMGGYYTYEELEEQLSQINSEYPSLTELTVIGNTFEGRNVWALKLSDNASQDENEPEVLYTGLHHAREPMGYMNLFFFMDWLLENYNTDDLATHLINNRQLWFIPAVNPDGLVYNESIAPNGGGMQRKNMRETCDGGADGIDLNRNYSYMWAYDNEGSSPDGCNETYRGNSPFSEPETQIVRDFVLSHDFPIALNYHSYGNLFIYPLGYEYDNQVPEDDLEVFIELGEDMTQYNGYALGSGPDLLYTVNGEACDWMYGEQGIFAYTPEIGTNQDGFWPQTNRIVPLAEENLYPNQFLALVAGSKYKPEISLEDTGPFTSDGNYPLNIFLFNQGLGDSNGEVHIEIIHSDNLEFELDEITLSGLDARELMDLGNITYFTISSDQGSVETIEVNVYDDDNYVYSQSFQIITGDTEMFINQEFESFNNQGWSVGDLNDDATNGFWELGIPNATYDESGNMVQTNEDHTVNGTTCYLTENSSNPNSPGQGDVDGGQTTLLSPVYDLSQYSGAIVSYWKWYTNNQGNNPGTDIWKVQISNDAGENWTDLENITSSNNYWKLEQFYINDYIDISSQVQFQFIAEDIYHEGDNGSGGSLVEAAIDDFVIQGFTDNGCLLGDFNQDTLINVQDIIFMINIILGPIEDITDYLCFGDFNQDGTLNIQDVILLVTLILD